MRFSDLKPEAQEWALEQIDMLRPIHTREETPEELLSKYDFNRFGDIVEEVSP